MCLFKFAKTMHSWMNSQTSLKIYIALPVMAEYEYLPAVLECLEKQSFRNFELVVCVNQPEEYSTIPDKIHIYKDNQRCLNLLNSSSLSFDIEIIDKSSLGMGWKGKQQGVGFARKTAMDFIAQKAKNDDIILSLDADTIFGRNYLEVIAQTFYDYPFISALSIPYYHPLTQNEITNRCILRYEIYMRVYALNMLFIHNPYAFTAMGSSMALKTGTYRKIGGLTPHQAGEDFYFLQKLRKHGSVLTWCPTIVFPASRFSDRVIFGTGPAMIRGKEGHWEAYPIFYYSLFDRVRITFEAFPKLYFENIVTPMDAFLKDIFRTSDIWGPLRKNSRNEKSFVKACTQKIDALRIFQFLKRYQPDVKKSDEICLKEFLMHYFPDNHPPINENLDTCDINALQKIRNFLAMKEYSYRQHYPLLQ
jgi:glycosyltransferase involved in cell wall biosynthesis